MMKLPLLLIAVASLLGIGCSSRNRCECPGCEKDGGVTVTEYFALKADWTGVKQKKEVWLCQEHYDKRPGTWPGTFLEVGREEQARINVAKAEAAKEAEKLNRAEWEKSFPENTLERSGKTLAFKPRFSKKPQPGSTVAFIYSRPGSPALDEAALKKGPFGFDPWQADQFDRGLDLSRTYGSPAVRATVVIPEKTRIADGQLVSFHPRELDQSESLTAGEPGAPTTGPQGMGSPGGIGGPPGGGGNGPPDRITGAVAEFERTERRLQLIHFLTPVCVAKMAEKR